MPSFTQCGLKPASLRDSQTKTPIFSSSSATSRCLARNELVFDLIDDLTPSTSSANWDEWPRRQFPAWLAFKLEPAFNKVVLNRTRLSFSGTPKCDAQYATAPRVTIPPSLNR